MSRASAGLGRAWRSGATVLALSTVLFGPVAARADKIKNGNAVFSGLDKITGRLISFKAAMGETVQFGSLQVTPRACFTRPAKEAPQTDSFVEVEEVSTTKEFKRIFSGWMFAASPGLHGLEHPIYDIWLTGCERPGDTVVETPQTADAGDAGAVATAPAGSDAAPAPDAAAAAVPVPAPNAGASAPSPKPKPRRVIARPALPPRVGEAAPAVAERREPTQRFFPTSQYPSDFAGRDPAGNSSH